MVEDGIIDYCLRCYWWVWGVLVGGGWGTLFILFYLILFLFLVWVGFGAELYRGASTSRRSGTGAMPSCSYRGLLSLSTSIDRELGARYFQHKVAPTYILYTPSVSM